MKFNEKFKNIHVILPVVHVESEKQAFANVEIAFEEGADGVFLINHKFNCEHLLEIYKKIREKYKNEWIGLNCLDKEPMSILSSVPLDVDGVWTDNANIDERETLQLYAEIAFEASKDRNWQGLYFGGVAFKYQRGVTDLQTAVKIAKNYMDVITTSGAGTGIAAHVEKIAEMKKAAGDFPIAIASGITAQNIKLYLPYANCFLVATGISKNFKDLDREKVRELIQIARNYNI